jgi:decaprenylphospho-beta-D-ribofuranose 2-oxidase
MTTIDGDDGPTGDAEDLESYSGLHREHAEVCHPEDVGDLVAIFERARQEDLRVTVRAGGHAFDAQSLPGKGGLVVSMCNFNTIEVDDGPGHPPTVMAQAGATWGAVVDELAGRGLVPAVTVTTEHATVGGTLAGDCLSRFSPTWGKFGEWIESFELLTVNATEPLTCKRPTGVEPPYVGDVWKRLGREHRLFFGAVGGLGYLGVVISVKFRVVPVPKPVRVATHVDRYESFADLAGHLVPAAAEMRAAARDTADPAKADAVYAALAAHEGCEEGLLMASSYTTDPLRPMALFRPGWPPRIVVEWLMRRPLPNRLIWWLGFHIGYVRWQDYVDELKGFSFFMDGNVNAKRAARKLGAHLTILQQTFIVPADVGEGCDHTAAQDCLVDWLGHADGVLTGDLAPTLLDVLYLPKDERFLLSATEGMAGFAVTYTFEHLPKRIRPRLEAALAGLSRDVLGRGGRVYLVKNVFAEPAVIREMYGETYEDFFALKAEVDPGGILVNDFLKDTFGLPTRADGPQAPAPSGRFTRTPERTEPRPRSGRA